MFLTTKTYLEADHMTHLHFTLETKEIQSLIEKSVKDELSKNILTVFNQLMEEQRTQYIQATDYDFRVNVLASVMATMKESRQLESAHWI